MIGPQEVKRRKDWRLQSSLYFVAVSFVKLDGAVTSIPLLFGGYVIKCNCLTLLFGFYG